MKVSDGDFRKSVPCWIGSGIVGAEKENREASEERTVFAQEDVAGLG